MARSETAAEKPAFRDPFRYGRCLILADGFYEWRTEPDGSKQPFYFTLRSKQPFGFAGLWDRWRANDGRVLATCAILTQEASSELRIVHTRMPVVVAPSHYERWLDPDRQDPEAVRPVIRRSVPESAFEVYPVSTRVNDVSNDDAELIVPY
jgi:putative SOS response-associated peptidase YedK